MKRTDTKPTTASRQRLNLIAAVRRLHNSIARNFGGDAVYAVLKLKKRPWKTPQNLVYTSFKRDVLTPLRVIHSGMKYIYAIKESAEGFFIHLVADCTPEELKSVYEKYWLCGGFSEIGTLSETPLDHIETDMTYGIFNGEAQQGMKMYISSRNMEKAQKDHAAHNAAAQKGKEI